MFLPFKTINRTLELNTTNLSEINHHHYHHRAHQFNISTESFQLKLEKLIETWRQMPYNDDDDEQQKAEDTNRTSMADVFEHMILVDERAQSAKLISIYGLGEDTLPLVYIEKVERGAVSNVGGFSFERSEWCAQFLDMFFKLTFDHTEDWSHLIQGVNRALPLLTEFYDEIRAQEIAHLVVGNQQFVEKMYLIEPEMSLAKMRENNNIISPPLLTRKQRRRQFLLLKDENEDFKISTEQRRGLFRTYSVKTLSYNQSGGDNAKLRKAVSFSDVSLQKVIVDKLTLKNR